MDEVPCVIASDLTDEQIKALRLADNKTGELAQWDDALLNIELDELSDFDMSDFGFDFDVDEEPKEKEGNFDESDYNYTSQYAVTVMCANESEQEKCYNTLVEMGYECKVVTV